MILLITYDLNSPGKNYNDLYKEIKKDGIWWHHLDSTWIIDTLYTPAEWQKRLKKHMDDNDSLFIVEICNNHQGWLPKKAWEWLQEIKYHC